MTVGGTSLAAPAMTGMFANALGGRTVGIGDIHGALYSGRAGVLRDITTGGNTTYPARSGFDLSTGLGVPIWNALGAWLTTPNRGTGSWAAPATGHRRSGATRAGQKPSLRSWRGVALPVLGDLDVQVEVDPACPSSASICVRARVPTSRSRAPPRPMTMRLLARRARRRRWRGRRPVSARSSRGHHLLDDDGERVRQLVAHALERGLADQLGDHHQLRLVGELAVGVERRPLGQPRDQQVGQQRRPGRRRPRDTGTISAQSPSSRHGQQLLGEPVPVGTRSVLVTTATTGVRSAVELPRR